MSCGFKYNYPKIARESGFKLRQFKDGPLDWRFIGSLQVENIIRKQQFEDIDTILSYLAEAPLGCLLESSVLESGVAKYFVLSQLALQYLIFCRKFLDETVKTLRESLQKAEADNTKLRAVNQGHSNEILQLYKKISQIEAINDVVYPCHVCTKNFISNDALNTHLSKKHSKNSTAEAPGKDVDRNLINTIKLELEIKQLKERLNVAEKDIRETVESKRDSPREKTKVCSGTQFYASTSDVGTQSNLCETKEFDSSDEADKLEILSPLMEKLSQLETYQDSQRTLNQESINDIAKKLNDITDALQSKSKQDSENFRKVVEDAITSKVSLKNSLPTNSADELQSILSNAVSEILHLNSEKLNDILTKMETICKENSPYLKLQGEREISPNPKPMKSAGTMRNATNILSSNVSELHLRKQKPAPHESQTYSVDKPLPNCSSKDIQDEESSTDVSESHIDNVEDSNLMLKELKMTEQVIQTIDRKMSYYGINPSTKKLSAAEAINISEHLMENRRSLKKTYPRFYATRNKFKNAVDRLSGRTQIIGNYQKDAKPIKCKHAYTNQTEHELSESKAENNENFKRRLEKILSSPIKRPNTRMSSLNESKKPIPMPRKRVIFHSPADGNML